MSSDYRFGLHYPIPSPVPGGRSSSDFSLLQPDERARAYRDPDPPDWNVEPWNCSECGGEIRASSFNRTHCDVCGVPLHMDCAQVVRPCEECLEATAVGTLPLECYGSHTCPSCSIPGKCLCGRDSAEPEGR
jgi:hypothetical protein